MSSWPFSPRPNSTSGRFCRSAPPATATRPMRAHRPLPAIPSHQPRIPLRLGLDRGRAHRGPCRPRRQRGLSILRWRSASSRCSTRRPATFSTAPPARPKLAAQWRAVPGVLPGRGRLAHRLRSLCRLRRQFNDRRVDEWPEPLRRREPEALAQAAAQHARGRPRSRCCSLPSPSVEQLREAAAAKRDPHPGRRGHLRQHGFGRRLGSPGTFRAG
jgi:hypothetical protein